MHYITEMRKTWCRREYRNAGCTSKWRAYRVNPTPTRISNHQQRGSNQQHSKAPTIQPTSTPSTKKGQKKAQAPPANLTSTTMDRLHKGCHSSHTNAIAAHQNRGGTPQPQATDSCCRGSQAPTPTQQKGGAQEKGTLCRVEASRHVQHTPSCAFPRVSPGVLASAPQHAQRDEHAPKHVPRWRSCACTTAHLYSGVWYEYTPSYAWYICVIALGLVHVLLSLHWAP